MAAVINRLSADASKLKNLNASGLWISNNCSVDSTENSEFSTDTTYKQLRISPTAASCSLSLDVVKLNEEDIGEDIILTFATAVPSGGSIAIVLGDALGLGPDVTTNYTIAATNAEGISQTGLDNPRWGIVRSEKINLIQRNSVGPHLKITITFTPNSQSDVILFTRPVVSGKYDFWKYGEATRQLAKKMPDHLVNSQPYQQEPDDAFLRFVDVAFESSDRSIKALYRYRYQNDLLFYVPDDDAAKSRLVDPDFVDNGALPWLIQFSGTEPIKKLNSSVDPSDPFILNSSLLDGPDTIRFSASGELDPPTNTSEVQREFQSWQAKYGFYGMAAGTIPAIESAVKRVMIGEKAVVITHQPYGPFTLLIETPWDQTYGGAEDLIGTSSPIVVEAVNYAKPVGVKIEHIFT